MHRVAIIYDCDGWAYHRRALALQKYAPPDFRVDIVTIGKWEWSRGRQYDLVFNMEYAAPGKGQRDRHCPRVPLVVSYNSDSARRSEFWTRCYHDADLLICNNMDVWDFHGRPERTCCISNGVDTDVFRSVVPIEQREHRVFWCGSTSVKKGKGFDILRSAHRSLESLGFVPDFRPIDRIDERVLKTDPLVDLYNQCSYVACMSSTEGTPNFVTEAVACGAVAVSTNVGNIREWGRNRENCVLVERTAESLIEGLLYAREHRVRLSEAGRDELASRWSYGEPGRRAEWYFAAFRRLLDGGTVRPFTFLEGTPDGI